MEETNGVEFFGANLDVGCSWELVLLGLGQIGAVDDPMVIHVAVVTVLVISWLISMIVKPLSVGTSKRDKSESDDNNVSK